jgi:hypothetical protein
MNGLQLTSTAHSYFFDLDNNLLVGNTTQPLASPTLRVLKSNNVEQVTQDIKAKYAYLASQNAFRRAEQQTHASR